MAFDAGSITSTLGIDISPFATGMLQATSIARLFPESVTDFLANPLLGVVDIAEKAADAIKEAFIDVSSSTHELGLQAQRAGVSAEFLEDIGSAAQSSGVGIDEVAHSFAFLARNAADARQGNESAMQSFSRLGVSLFEAGGHAKDAQQLFRDVADAISRVKGTGLDVQGAMDLLSRGGIEMLPLLQKGSAGIAQVAETMKAASGGMREDQVAISDQAVLLGQVWSEVWEGVRRSLAVPVLEVVAAHADELQHAAIAAGAAMRGGIGVAMSFLIDRADHLAPSFAAISSAFGGAVAFVQGHAALFIGAIAPILSPTLWTVAAGAASALFGVVLAGLGAIFSPLGLAVAAFAALGAAIGSDRLKAGFNAAVDGIKAGINWISSVAVPVIRGDLVRAFNAVAPEARAMATSAFGGLREGIEWIERVAIPVIRDDFSRAWAAVAPEARIFAAELSNDLRAAIASVDGAIRGLFDYFGLHADSTLGSLKLIGLEIKQWLPSLDQVVAAAKGALSYVEAASDLLGVTDPNKRYGNPYASPVQSLTPDAVAAKGSGGVAELGELLKHLDDAFKPLGPTLAASGTLGIVKAANAHGEDGNALEDEAKETALTAAGTRAAAIAAVRAVSDLQSATGKVDPGVLAVAVDRVKAFSADVDHASEILKKWQGFVADSPDRNSAQFLQSVVDGVRSQTGAAGESLRSILAPSSPLAPAVAANAASPRSPVLPPAREFPLPSYPLGNLNLGELFGQVSSVTSGGPAFSPSSRSAPQTASPLLPAATEANASLRTMGRNTSDISAAFSTMYATVARLTPALRSILAAAPAAPTPAAQSASSAGGTAAAGRANVNIANIIVPSFDVSEATSQIAAKMLPAIRDAVHQQKRQLAATTQATLTQGGL